MGKVDFLNHIKHPFTDGTAKLSSKQKKITFLASAILMPFLAFPGFLAFYGISYYFKNKNIKHLNGINLLTTSKTNFWDSLIFLREGGKQLKIPDISSLDDILCLDADRQQCLTYLYENQPHIFKNLFVEALEKKENDFVACCLWLMNREELNEILKSCGNFKLTTDDKEILSHKTILVAIFPLYFEPLFESGMLEVTQGEIHLEKDEFELFESILNALMFKEDLEINGDNLTGYLEISEKYQLSRLKTQCVEFMKDNLFDFDDAEKIFELADRYGLSSIEAKIKRLVSKAVKEGKVDEYKIDFLSQCLPHIRELKIEGVYNQDLLSQCISLEKLSIKSSNKSFLNFLSNFSNLKHLKIECAILENKDLESFQGLQLISLDLRGCFEIRGSGLINLKGMLLQYLNVSWCEFIDDEGLAHLEGMPLKYLNVSGCEQVTDEGLAHLKGILLQSLDVSWCKFITDKGLAHLKRMPLKYLNGSGCEQVTDEGLAHLKGMPLKKLKLKNCEKLTNNSLDHLRAMPLKYLNVSGSQQVTHKKLGNLKIRRRHVVKASWG